MSNGAQCRRIDDEPHAVVIELTQPITCAEAQELGKLLGKHGYTGTFVGGDVAALVKLGAEYKRKLANENRDKQAGA